MKLAPVETRTRPRYPSRAAEGRLKRWARRLGAATGAALLLGTGGCYGAQPWSELEESDGEREDVDRSSEARALVNHLVPLMPIDSDEEPPPDPAPEPLPPTPDPAPQPPEPEICEVEYRLSGAVAPTSTFSCEPAPEPSFEAPIYMTAGEMCGDEPAWARFEVAEAFRAIVTLLPGTDNTVLTLIDPTGEPVAVLGPAEECTFVDLGPGAWTLRAEPADPTAYPTGYFELSIDAAGSDPMGW